MAEAVTRPLGGSAACGWEAEPPRGAFLGRAKERGGERGRGDLADRLSIEIVGVGIDNLHRN